MLLKQGVWQITVCSSAALFTSWSTSATSNSGDAEGRCCKPAALFCTITYNFCTIDTS